MSGYTRALFDARGAPMSENDGEKPALEMEIMLHVAPLLPYDSVNP